MSSTSILDDAARDIAGVLGKAFTVTASRTVHLDGDEAVHLCVAVYVSDPWTSIVQVHDHGPRSSELKLARGIVKRAEQWWRLGLALSDVGCPLCADCYETDTAMTLATEEHCGRHYCRSCYDNAAESQWVASHEGCR